MALLFFMLLIAPSISTCAIPCRAGGMLTIHQGTNACLIPNFLTGSCTCPFGYTAYSTGEQDLKNDTLKGSEGFLCLDCRTSYSGDNLP